MFVASVCRYRIELQHGLKGTGFSQTYLIRR